MTRKNFVALADDIRVHNAAAKRSPMYTAFTNDQLEMLAQFCENQNIKFDRDRWLNYVQAGLYSDGGTI